MPRRCVAEGSQGGDRRRRLRVVSHAVHEVGSTVVSESPTFVSTVPAGALEGANVAPGTMATLRELTNPARRPLVARHALSQEILRSEPVEALELDGEVFLTCLKTARRGAAAGPSGMTADHLFSIFESQADSELLVQVASKVAVGDVPNEVIDSIRVGWLTALAKPDGGVRGIVVGDIFRRLVARTIAKQFAKKAEAATAPFQNALST